MTAKIALVTGASRGLGKNIALALAQKGIEVIITYNTQKEKAEEVVKEIRKLNRKADAMQFDISNIKAIGDFIERVKASLKNTWQAEKFDFLINNAGTGVKYPIAQATEEDFDGLLNIHYKGVFFLTQKSLEILNDKGAIVFISSGTTRYCIPGHSIYASLKGAIEVFSRYVAKEFGNRGIRANVIAPGAIETEFNGSEVKNNPKINSFLASQTALGRVGLPDDIGGVAAFLCTDEARWINAQRIEVSGGMFL